VRARLHQDGVLAKFTPLLVSAGMQLPSGGYQFETYLPPSFLKGTSQKALPFDLLTTIARFREMSYLPDNHADQEQMIGLKLTKDFQIPDQILMNVKFGRLKENGRNRSVEIDTDDPQSALVLRGNLEMPIRERDGLFKRIVKRNFNKHFSSFQVETAIHELGMALTRESAKDQKKRQKRCGHFVVDDENPPEQPLFLRYHPATSKLSFKVFKKGLPYKEKKRLIKIGFQCRNNTTEPKLYDCQQEFSTWQGFLRKGTGWLTRKILGYSLPDIEDDLDEMISEMMKKFFIKQ
jgi:hypothetical protein